MCRRHEIDFTVDKEFSKLELSVPDYEKAELDLLRHALKRSYTERFDKMMQLIKMNIMLRNAKISRPD
jgi:hypothetical protein